MCSYPASYSFNEADEIYLIHFRDFPDLQSITYSLEDVALEAQEGIKNAIASAMEERSAIPSPSALKIGEIAVHVPLLWALKAQLYNTMLVTETTKADMARKLSLNAAQMDRLLSVYHASKVEILEQALYLLGYTALVTVKKLA